MPDLLELDSVETHPESKAYYENKRLFYKNLFWLLLWTFCINFGIQAALTLMPLHMAKVNLSAQQISTVLAISNWFVIPAILYSSYLTDHGKWKFGKRLPFLAITMPFILITMALFPFTRTISSCLLLYLVYYIATNIRASTFPYIANDISKKQYWGRMAAWVTLASFAGLWAGQFFLLPLGSKYSENIVFYIAAAAIGISSIAALFFLKEPPNHSTEKPEYNPVPVVTSVLKFAIEDRKRTLTCVAFALICGTAMVSNYIPLQAKVNLHLSEAQIGRAILQYGTFFSIFMYFFSGWMVDKLGSARTMLIGYCLQVPTLFLGVNPDWAAGIINSCTGLHLTSVQVLASAYVLNGMVNPFVYTPATVFIVKSVQRADIAKFCACTGSFNLFGQAVFYTLSGIIISNFFGGNYGFSFIIAFILISMGIPLFLYIENSYKKQTEQAAASSGEIPLIGSGTDTR